MLPEGLPRACLSAPPRGLLSPACLQTLGECAATKALRMSHALDMPALLGLLEQIVENPTLFGVPETVVQQVALKQKAAAAVATSSAGGGTTTAAAEGHISRIRSLQGKIQEVEVQASIREVQVKILEIKIKQVELMSQVRPALPPSSPAHPVVGEPCI